MTAHPRHDGVIRGDAGDVIVRGRPGGGRRAPDGRGHGDGACGGGGRAPARSVAPAPARR